MLRARLIVLLVLALALSASVVITASAAAAELPEFTVESGYTGTSGKVTLESKGGTKVTCGGSSIEGTALSKRHGTFKLKETECTKGEAKCTTSGEPTGTIKVSGDWSLATKAEKKEAFVKLTTSGAAFSCNETAEEINGSILAAITPLSTKTTKFELLVKETKGKPEFTEYVNDSGEKKSVQLLLSSKGGAFEEAGEEFASDKLTTTKETELKFGAVANVTVLPGNVIDLKKIELNETKTAAFTYKVEAGSPLWWVYERTITPLLAANEFTYTLTKDECFGKLLLALATCKVEISLEAKVAGKFAEVQFEMVGGAPLVKVKGES